VSTHASGAQASGASADPFLSGDGRYLVFTSHAADLVADDIDTNGVADVFVKDLQTQAIVRVSAGADGSLAGGASTALGISADGLQIVFSTSAALAAGDSNGQTDIVNVVNPLIASGGGIDSVQASVSTTLAANVENLLLTGSAAINGTGNGLANRLAGNGSNNRLDGGTGADTMTGGAGNDSYIVQNGADVVVELAGGGTDSVSTSVSYSLSAEVEHLLLTGSNNSTLTGNSLANRITGNGGNNKLDGGSDADTLTGGAGNDSYLVQNSGDLVVELAGGGYDSVSSSIGYTLPAEIERLTLTGSGDGHGSGNGLHNTITGNSGDNKLRGSTGNDTLTGGGGADIFRFSSALSASNNVDTVIDFNPAEDVLELENTVFAKLTATGGLSASNFRAHSSGAAADSNDFVVYETDTGRLFYDADGSGAGASVLIATFSNLPALTASDIFVT
jgi:Ca2+-binding RTX toxin-like protein